MQPKQNMLVKVINGFGNKPIVPVLVEWIEECDIDAQFNDMDRVLQLIDMLYAKLSSKEKENIVRNMMKIAIRRPYLLKRRQAKHIFEQAMLQGLKASKIIVTVWTLYTKALTK